ITYTMNSDGETYADESKTLYGTAGEPATAATPDVEGFTFNAEKSTISGTIAGDGSLVLEVYYDRNKITVDVNGEEDEYFYDDKIEEPTPAPVDPNGGSFEGWEDEDGNPVEFPYNVPDEEDKEIIITPVYHYTVVYMADGAEVLTVKDRAGTALEAPEAPAKEGYNFIKWVDADGKTPADYGTIPEANLEFNAIYETSAYQVIYWVNGTIVANKSAEYGETIVTGVDAEAKKVNLLNYSTPDGYEFDGWYTDAACTTKLAEGATVGAAVVNLYAKETEGTYDAVFMVDGEVYATVPTVFEAAIVLPEEPTKEGWTFTGWSPDATIMDREGMTFEATWVETAGAYTATYYVDGEVYEEYALALGDDLDVPADPFKKGYEFMGWATKADAVTADVVELPATMPAEDLVYYAVFELRSAAVNFYNNKALDVSPYMSDETEVYFTADVMVGDIIEMPADPTNIDAKYYTFMGWTDVEGGTEAIYTADSEIEMVAEGIDLYAVYERVAVKLMPMEDSTTVIERDGLIESYLDDSVTTEGYDTEGYTELDYELWFVYGLDYYLWDMDLEEFYLEVQGDGYMEIETVTGTEDVGTGTVIRVYDNVTGEMVEKFYVVIYGDLDGDGILTPKDSAMMITEVSEENWSGFEIVEYMLRAGDLDDDFLITPKDSSRLIEAVAEERELDQTYGLL
ncbi:MAG: InlB B-repeat-containing protein, partial [Clostridia bacterium]|nr:InlB B-repeat-containing protein [Clostridia bacterium]